VPDWMHEIMVLCKQFMHATYDMLLHVLSKRPKGVPKFCYTQLLLMFRKDIPTAYSRSRRIPWGMSHTDLKSWTAEECLVWLRLCWRHFFQELREYVRSWPESVLQAELLIEIGMFQTLWTHISGFYARLSHLNGMQGSPSNALDLAVDLVDFVANTKLGGRPFFSDGYCTYTFHVILHIVQFVLWWGNMPEHWCFLYERCAEVFTRLLRGYNHGANAGASGWLMDRTHLKLVCTLDLEGRLSSELAALGCTELAGTNNIRGCAVTMPC